MVRPRDKPPDSPGKLLRGVAEALAAPFVVKHAQYSVVSRDDARTLLGAVRLFRLESDKRRGWGPPGFDGFYYWNVADYVQDPNLKPHDDWVDPPLPA